MIINAVQVAPKRASKETYVIFLAKGEKIEPFDVRDQWVKRALEREEFENGFGEIAILSSPEPDSPRYVCVGAGESDTATAQMWLRLIGTICRFLQNKKIARYTLALPFWYTAKPVDILRSTVVAIYASTYRFNRYITDVARIVLRPKTVTLFVPHDITAGEATGAIQVGVTIGKAADNVRELGNMPPIHMTPTVLAQEAKKVAHGKLVVKTLGPKQLKKEKMNGILAVSEGSKEDAQFIIMEYRGGKKNEKPLVFAGKAVTFDSGGISLKPSQKMDEMKFDMLGGATVIAILEVVAALNLPITVVGLVGAAENVPGDGAYRPGDIITAKNGKTIEILNTDAEGRVILADVLSYASMYKPKTVIDIATLTGACVVALGENYAGVFSRSDEIALALKKAGLASGEHMWHMPLDDDFKKNVQSTIADTRNTGVVSDGDASNAAAFLEYFTDYPWVHVDIAGTAWGGDKPYRSVGATGSHVDALVRFVEEQI